MSQYSAPTGVTARYIGPAGGTTTWYYWVQAIYPSGKSQLSASGNTGGSAQSSLTSYQFNNVQWNPTPGAIGYVAYRSTSSTIPVTSASTYIVGFTSETGFKDDGTFSTTTGIPRYDGLYVAHMIWDFAVDGGSDAAAITPANSDTIPKGALVIGGVSYCQTSVTGSTDYEIGTSAGSSTTSLIGSTAVPSAGAVKESAAVGTPFIMTAVGQITITLTVANATAGVIEFYALYVMSSYL